MKEVRNYMIEEINVTPNIKDIEECIRIAKEKDCIVKLSWRMKYSGNYSRFIYATDDTQDVFTNRIPHMYGL